MGGEHHGWMEIPMDGGVLDIGYKDNASLNRATIFRPQDYAAKIRRGGRRQCCIRFSVACLD